MLGALPLNLKANPLWAFCGIFDDIPRNVWRHFPEYLATFPGMFGDIPWNIWRYFP